MIIKQPQYSKLKKKNQIVIIILFYWKFIENFVSITLQSLPDFS